jgi:hypothetical protein
MLPVGVLHAPWENKRANFRDILIVGLLLKGKKKQH